MQVSIVAASTILREGMRCLLKRAGCEVVGTCGSLREAAAILTDLRPEVAFVSAQAIISRDQIALQSLAQVSPATRYVIFGMGHHDNAVIAAAAQGANCYLADNYTSEWLNLAARAAQQGFSVGCPKTLARLCASIPNGGQREREDHSGDLTRQERQVLSCIAEGLSNREIALRLAISVSTVRNHVSNILYKLDVKDRVQAAVYAVESGLVPQNNLWPAQ